MQPVTTLFDAVSAVTGKACVSRRESCMREWIAASQGKRVADR